MFSKALLLATPALAYLDSQQQIPIQPLQHSQGYRFDPLLHLPGISPYFDAVGFGLEHTAPTGCNVTAASYIVRHGAIYANDDEYEEFIKPFLWKLEKHRDGPWSGPLAFMAKWQSPVLEDRLEDLTPSGAVDAQNVGKHLLERYPDLVPNTRRILADKKSRTYDTAENLIKAFPHNDTIEIVRVTTNVNGSMESLIPHKSCENFSKAPGTKEQNKFINMYGKSTAKRLRPYMPFELSPFDVVGLQQLCGYESAITGKRSEICAVFTDAEWMAYEYSWDLKYAYMVGPMNPLSPYLGFPWLQTQSELFRNIQKRNHPGDSWPEDQRFFLGFTHREVPPFIATALGLFNSSSGAAEEFPTDHINVSPPFPTPTNLISLLPTDTLPVDPRLAHGGPDSLPGTRWHGTDVVRPGCSERRRPRRLRPLHCQHGTPAYSCMPGRTWCKLQVQGIQEADWQGLKEA